MWVCGSYNTFKGWVDVKLSRKLITFFKKKCQWSVVVI